jgi:hypothetical protein
MEAEMNEEPSHFKRRAMQYWFNDGLGELLIGAIFLGLGLIFYGITVLSSRSPLAYLLGLGLIPLILGGFLFARRMLSALKERVTFPRTGYVSYLRPPRKQRYLLPVAILAILLLANLVNAAAPNPRDLSPLLDGLVLAALLLLIGQGLWRFFLLAGLSFLTGLGLYLLRLEGYPAHSAFYALAGLALLVSGGLTLWRYLYSTRSTVMEDQP